MAENNSKKPMALLLLVVVAVLVVILMGKKDPADTDNKKATTEKTEAKQSGWSEEDKAVYSEKCVATAVEEGMLKEQATTDCQCTLGVIESQFDSFSDMEKWGESNPQNKENPSDEEIEKFEKEASELMEVLKESCNVK